MRIGVFADIEGSFGVWRMRQCRMGTREWQYARGCLTEDVNNVVDGAFDGGADRVTVKDTHEVGFNILRHKLDPRAKYVGGHYVSPTFFGNVRNYDMVMYVAIHAASGTKDAFFAHTHYGVFSELLINGKPVSEMELYGAYLAEFGVPIGFFSGEDIAVEQASRALPWAKSVIVDKRQETYTASAKTLEYLTQGRKQLREQSAEAVRSAPEMKLLKMEGPLHFVAKFAKEGMAEKFNTWNFPQHGNAVSWDAANMVEGFNMLNKLTFFPKNIYPYRRPLLFATRKYYFIKSTFFAPEPNPEGAPMA